MSYYSRINDEPDEMEENEREICTKVAITTSIALPEVKEIREEPLRSINLIVWLFYI